jgi:hypothetical protein
VEGGYITVDAAEHATVIVILAERCCLPPLKVEKTMNSTDFGTS